MLSLLQIFIGARCIRWKIKTNRIRSHTVAFYIVSKSYISFSAERYIEDFRGSNGHATQNDHRVMRVVIAEITMPCLILFFKPSNFPLPQIFFLHFISRKVFVKVIHYKLNEYYFHSSCKL